MNFREMNLAVFQRKPLPHVFFQPRFEPWYDWHKTFQCMPPRFAGMSLRDMYDEMQVSMRTVHYYTGMPDPIRRDFTDDVVIHRSEDGINATIVYETPYGNLTEGLKHTQDNTWRTVDFPVKSAEDFPKLRWLFEHMRFSFDADGFAQGDAFVGPRGVPSFWVPKSPYQALAQQWMRLENLIYALVDCRQEVEDTMRVIDDSYDGLYEQLTAAGNLQILNFGENLHDSLLNPRYLERYLLPFYEKRSNQLRQAGIFTHVHLDGYFHSWLKYLHLFPFDGLEALTPVPQGDVTLEEIKEHIGDKILLDGIPAVLFMNTYSREELMETVEKVVKLFHPRLVLGVSDEVPEGADEEAINRLEMVSAWSRAYKP